MFSKFPSSLYKQKKKMNDLSSKKLILAALNVGPKMLYLANLGMF